MKNLSFYLPILAIALLSLSCSDDENYTTDFDADTISSAVENELSSLTSAVQPLFDFNTAMNSGYSHQLTDFVRGVGNVYLNSDLLDDNFELLRPELLIFTRDKNGTMQCVAVGFAAPANTKNQPPEGFTGSGDVWKLDTELGLWTLTVWIGLENPNGIFSNYNPLIN